MALNASESDMGENQDFFAVQLSVIVFAWHLLIVVLGVPGNVLILIVFWAKPRRTSTAVLIMALAAADLFACLARLCEVVYQGIELSGGVPPFKLYLTITVVNNLSLTAAALMTALIALDRYDCICRNRNRLLNHRRSYAAVAFVCGLDVLANVPLFVYISGNHNWSLVVFSKQVLFYFADVLVVFVCYGMVYAAIRRHVRVGVNRLAQADPNPSVLSDTSRYGISFVQGKRASGTFPIISDLEAPGCCSGTAPSSCTSGKAFLDSRVSGVAPSLRSTGVAGGGVQGSGVAGGGIQGSGVAGGGIQGSGVAGGGVQGSAPAPSRKEPINPESCQGKPLATNAGQPRAFHRSGAPPTTLQRKTTLMLFLATLVFLLTYIPYWIFVGMTFAGRPPDAAYEIMRNVLNLMFINNTINPLIYGLANRRFRNDVRVVLRKMCGRKSTE